jgi:hypothetical protein
MKVEVWKNASKLWSVFANDITHTPFKTKREAQDYAKKLKKELGGGK